MGGTFSGLDPGIDYDFFGLEMGNFLSSPHYRGHTHRRAYRHAQRKQKTVKKTVASPGLKANLLEDVLKFKEDV